MKLSFDETRRLWSLSLTEHECVVLSGPTYEDWSHYRGQWWGRRSPDGRFSFRAARKLSSAATRELDRVAELALARYRTAIDEGVDLGEFAGWDVPKDLLIERDPAFAHQA